MKLTEIVSQNEYDDKTMVHIKPIYYVSKDDMDVNGKDDYLRKLADQIIWGDAADAFEKRIKEYDGKLSDWVYRPKGSKYKLMQDGDNIEDRPDGAMWDKQTLVDMIKQGAIEIK